MTIEPDIVITAGKWELTPWLLRKLFFKPMYRRWVVITFDRQVEGYWVYKVTNT